MKGRRKPPASFGKEVKILLGVWEKRGLPMSVQDIIWAKRYLELAEKVNSGDMPILETRDPKPFAEEELKVVKKLLFERRSIRQWKKKGVPQWMIDLIIEAGLAAPNACNMQCQRFLVLKDKGSMTFIKGDVEYPPVKIVICQDMRIYEWMDFPRTTAQNIYFDAAAAADHMCLMAHALGLGAVWMTHTKEQAERLRKHLELPEHYRMDTHIAIGWPDD